MQAFIVLADAAQHDESSGKINVLGGDWSLKDAGPRQTALAVFYRTTWDEATTARRFTLRLFDDGGDPVMTGEGDEERPLTYSGTIRLREGADTPGDPARLVDIHSSFAVTIPPLRLEPGRRYTWTFEVDDEVITSVAFAVRRDSDLGK